MSIKLSIKNLLIKKKQNFKEIELNNFDTNIDLKNLKKYTNIFTKKINFIPITFTRGKIIFFNKKNYVATFNDTDLDLIIQEDSKEAKLRGKFLNDNIYINFSRKKINNKPSTDIILKISNLNLLTKANYTSSKNDKNILNGDILIKKDKHRFIGVFDYKNNEITINKSNLKNVFLNGQLEGKIKISPYFNFDLDLNLDSINFTKLYNHFLDLDEKNQKNLFKINRKINGKLVLSSDKIYSKYNLVKSFESRIKFINENILKIDSYNSYMAMFQSKVVVGTTSTLLRENLAIGGKILSCNLLPTNIYDFPIQGICSIKNCTFEEFEKKLLQIYSISEKDYFSKLSKDKCYLVEYDEKVSTIEILKRKIDLFLADNY